MLRGKQRRAEAGDQDAILERGRGPGMLIILACRRLRREDHQESEASLDKISLWFKYQIIK